MPSIKSNVRKPEPTVRLLLVEDELFIRMDLADAFRDHGWDVVEVGTADDAIALLARDCNFIYCSRMFTCREPTTDSLWQD